MNLASLPLTIRRLLLLLRNKGIKYTYNQIHFHIFWGAKNPFIIRLLHWLKPYPSYIEIEVTTRCNLKCIMCEHTYWDEPNSDMTFEEFKSIVDQFPRLKWIGLTGIGESFINKDFMKILSYVKSKNVFVELYDTFYFIDEKTARELIEMGVDKIFISIDAATKETYERIRVGSNFDRVMNNVRNLIRLKKEMEAPFPVLSFHYIVTKLNLHEMLQYIELVNHLCNGEKIGIQFTRMLHEFEETKDLFVEVPSEIVEAVERRGKELDIPINWNLDVPQDKPPIIRCIEWIMPFIFVTGHVIPCCAGNEANRRGFQKETSLGNVFEKPFREIWHGERYRKFRHMIRKGEVPVQCENCPLYNTGGK